MKTTDDKNEASLIVISSIFLIGFFTFLARDFTQEDALIYYRYIRNFLEGNGLVYNTGERLNALTSPLYTYISLVACSLTREIRHSQLILSAIFFFTFIFSFYKVLRSDVPQVVRFSIPFLLASNVYFYFTFGLETTLFLSLIAVNIYLFKINNYFWLGISSACLLLTRGEGIFILLALFFLHLYEKRPFPNWKYFIVPIAMLLLYFGFNWFYFGKPFPNTFAAKIYHGKSGLMGEWPTFLGGKRQFFETFFNNNIILALMLGSAAVLGLIFNFKNRYVLAFFGALIAYNSFYIFMNIPNYYWYHSYNYFYLYFLVTLFLSCLYRKIHKKSPLIATTLLVIYIVALFSQQFSISLIRLQGIDGIKQYVTIGKWLRNNTPDDAQIASVEIGHIGWYSRRKIIDIMGLVNPGIAKWLGEHKYNKWLDHYQPDFFVVNNPLWSHHQSIRKLLNENKLTLVESFYSDTYRIYRMKKDYLPVLDNH